jgi:hypothetical protein
MLSGCADATGLGGARTLTSGTYVLTSYDGNVMPALYEKASYGSTTVLDGTVTVKLAVIDVLVNYIARDPDGATIESYSGSVSAIWNASSTGALTFTDGLGATYAIRGTFRGDSIVIAVPDFYTDGTSHTGIYKFVRQP